MIRLQLALIGMPAIRPSGNEDCMHQVLQGIGQRAAGAVSSRS